MSKYILMLLVMVLIIYTLPPMYATYSASHTTESNENIYCTSCHSYIANEMMMTNNSQDVLAAHMQAANNTNYITYLNIGGISYDPNAEETLDGTILYSSVIYTVDLINNEIGNSSTYDQNDIVCFWNTSGNSTWLRSAWNPSLSTFESLDNFVPFNLDMDNSSSIEMYESCYLCHSAVVFGLGIKHTSIVVRGCDDDRCHGNKNHAWADQELFDSRSIEKLNAGTYLSEKHGKYPVHDIFYNDLSTTNGYYLNDLPFGIISGNSIENGTKMSGGYWACLGCHTPTKFNITTTEPKRYMHTNYNATTRRYY